ncbi:MAG: DUF4173 domain-containing protein [Gemmatimonadales bacterium]
MMEDKSRIAPLVLAAALSLGLLADVLLRVGPWGLNMTLWMLALLFAAQALSTRPPLIHHPVPAWPALLALMFALGFAWRDAPGVKLFDAFAVVVALAIWVERREGARVGRWTVLDYLRGFLNSAVAAGAGAVALAGSDFRRAPTTRSQRLRHARSAGLGLLIAVPLLFVFGGLLMAADAVFERLVVATFDFDIADILSHGALIAFFAWITAGFLLVVSSLRQRAFSELRVDRPAVGIVEVGVPLVLTNLLFITFALVQFRYLFGDASLVEGTVGLTYSEYARRGFFELVWVVTLVLPLLLAADWVLAEADHKSRLAYRFLAGTSVALLIVVVASAVKRMLLYQSAYGLTEARLYTTAFMIWLGIVLLWFSFTVLRERRTVFTTGAALAGFGVIAAVNLVNPDALVARVNVSRALHGEEFDGAYTASLSGDAIPQLVAALPRLDLEQRCRAAARILERWTPSRSADWRTWSLGRARARHAVREARGQLEDWACEAAPSSPESDALSPAVGAK